MYKIETYLDENKLPVMEKTLICKEEIQVNSPEKVFQMLNTYFRLGSKTEEYVYMIVVDTKSHILGVFELSHGTVNTSFSGTKEIFMKALICGAVGIIIAHNHPSGDVFPSGQDIRTEQHIAEAGKLMGISLMDYLICSNKEYFSFGEKDMLSAEEKSA